MDGNLLRVERTIAAPAERIFAHLADAAKHAAIDGSGTVQQATAHPDAATTDSTPLALGTRFGMDMKAGIAYRMVNTVVEFEQDRRIAWQPRVPGLLGRVIGGRIWRYVLTPSEDGRSTTVAEEWDLSHEPGRLLIRMTLADATERNMTKTLERLAGLVEQD